MPPTLILHPRRSRLAPVLGLLGLWCSVTHSVSADVPVVAEPPKSEPGARTDIGATGASLPEVVAVEAALARAMGLYNSGQYAACAAELSHLPAEVRGPSESLEVFESARVYRGACLVGDAKLDEADAVFRDAIRQNPQMRPPDGLVFPSAVVERFLSVRASMLDEIRSSQRNQMLEATARSQADALARKREQERIQRLVELAETETVVERNQRWVASIPFGAGQFYERRPVLGWTFLLTETALVGTFAGAMVMDAWYESKYGEPGYDGPSLHARRLEARSVAGVAGFGLLGVVAVGILEAQVSFAPERSTRRRRILPQGIRQPESATSGTTVESAPKLSLRPWVMPESHGGSLGLSGQF